MDRTFAPQFSQVHHDGNGKREIPITKITGEVYELEDEMAMMVKAVRDGASVAATGEDGRWAVALCLAAARSVRTGGVVSIAEFPTPARNEDINPGTPRSASP